MHEVKDSIMRLSRLSKKDNLLPGRRILCDEIAMTSAERADVLKFVYTVTHALVRVSHSV